MLVVSYRGLFTVLCVFNFSFFVGIEGHPNLALDVCGIFGKALPAYLLTYLLS